jgi:hypothetical protein
MKFKYDKGKIVEQVIVTATIVKKTLWWYKAAKISILVSAGSLITIVGIGSLYLLISLIPGMQ